MALIAAGSGGGGGIVAAGGVGIAAATRLFEKFCLPFYRKYVGRWEKDQWLIGPQKHEVALKQLQQSLLVTCANASRYLQVRPRACRHMDI